MNETDPQKEQTEHENDPLSLEGEDTSEPEGPMIDDTPDIPSFENIDSDHGDNNDNKEAQIEYQLREELAQMKDQALRALAEAENVRKRAVKEREDARKFAISAFAKDLLDFADNFGRALQAIPSELAETDERVKGVIEGISAMDKDLLSTLGKHGITRIEPLDEMFDPNLHEVMFEAPMPDKQPGTIIQLIEPGYLLNDRLLRPARVGVAKGAEDTQRVDTQV